MDTTPTGVPDSTHIAALELKHLSEKLMWATDVPMVPSERVRLLTEVEFGLRAAISHVRHRLDVWKDRLADDEVGPCGCPVWHLEDLGHQEGCYGGET